MFEQSAIPEPVADARFDLVELVAETHDARSNVLSMAVDDAPRILGDILRHGDADLTERAHRHRKNCLRIPADAKCRNPLAVQQCEDDAGFNVRGGREHDDRRHHKCAGTATSSTLSRTSVRSSCSPVSPAK